MFFLIHTCIYEGLIKHINYKIYHPHIKKDKHTLTGINLYIRQAAMTHGKLMSGLGAEN